jgi:hypothetical protein
MLRSDHGDHQLFEVAARIAMYTPLATSQCVDRCYALGNKPCCCMRFVTQQYVDTGIAHYKAAEDMAVQGVKGMLLSVSVKSSSAL